MADDASSPADPSAVTPPVEPTANSPASPAPPAPLPSEPTPPEPIAPAPVETAPQPATIQEATPPDTPPIEATSEPPPSTETPQAEAQTPQTGRNEAFEIQKPAISSSVGNKAKQDKLQKKLDRIMELATEQGHIANDDVEKLLHVSNATATRYLGILKREGRLQQVGKTGKGVTYRLL